MSAFVSLAITLRGFYHLPLASLPVHVKQRILDDFSPWPWDKMKPRLRCHIAKQYDYDNDPARKEYRAGIRALTDPDSPMFSQTELERLRGDFLPVKKEVRLPRTLLPIEWDRQESVPIEAAPDGLPVTGSTAGQAPFASANDRTHDIPPRLKKRDLVTPVIERAQQECSDPFDTPSVWAKLLEAANAKRRPFFGATEAGLQWVNSEDQTKNFTLKQLRDRLRRQKKSS